MRSTTVLLFLLTLPATLAAPLPWTSHAASIADKLFGSRALSPEDTAAAVADLEAYLNVHSPFTPAADMPPSVVLALRRPIATTWLMSLSAKPGATRVTAATVAARPHGKADDVPVRIASTDDRVEAVFFSSGIEAAVRASKKAPVTSDKAAADDSTIAGQREPSDLLRPEEQVTRSSRVDIPCFYAQLRRDYNDMMVISLVAIFLLVIVAVEFWYSTEQEADAEVEPTGAIKLEDHQLLSYQLSSSK